MTSSRGTREGVRLRFGTLGALALCAASGAAAVAHYVIDIVGDFALPHDAYDDVVHSSRGLISGVALLLAVILAARGLRACCELATSWRGRLQARAFDPQESLLFGVVTVVLAAGFVPAMECLDGRLAGMPVKELDDAFGGSVALGLGLTLLCAVAVGAIVYGIARGLISHRDAIATFIETLRRPITSERRLCGQIFRRHLVTPRRRRTPHALRLCKRGPPNGGLPRGHHFLLSTKGDSRDFHLYSRYAGARGARRNARLCRAGVRGAAA